MPQQPFIHPFVARSRSLIGRLHHRRSVANSDTLFPLLPQECQQCGTTKKN